MSSSPSIAVLPEAHATAIPSESPANAQAESVEMKDLPAQPSVTAPAATDTIDPSIQPSSPTRTQINRSETADIFLGPDGAVPSNTATDSAEPILRITLMLTTGSRHPYTISSKYLASRKVTAVDSDGKFDPREMSAYKLKELIWTDWRPEWEPRPRDAAAIRLIILGRMLDDKSQLKDSPFSLESTNVVHMTVKPADLLDDEGDGAGKASAKSFRGRSSDGESAGCCRCVLQ